MDLNGNKTEKFVFASIPQNAEQLMALPEANLDSPYKTAALAILSLLMYEKDKETCFAMINALRGPQPLSAYDMQFIRDRMNGKEYKARSFFAGATVQNNYTPTTPLTTEVSSNPYSFTEENRATMYIKSSGADSPRQIKLRKKPSTNQWFVEEIQCLGDVREPASSDPWA